MHSPEARSLRSFLHPDSENEVYARHIPPLQRRYSWKAKDQVDQMLTDLWESFQLMQRKDSTRGRNYYLHEIVLATNPPEIPHPRGKKMDSERSVSEAGLVLDGQQRVLTLLAILRALHSVVPYGKVKDLFSGKDVVRLSKVEQQAHELLFYGGCLLTSHYPYDDNAIRAFQDEDLYLDEIKGKDVKWPDKNRLLMRAYFHARSVLVSERKLGGLKPAGEGLDAHLASLCKFRSYLLNNSYFTVSCFESINDAYDAFATGNNRGLSLSLYDMVRFYSVRQATELSNELGAETQSFWDDSAEGVYSVLKGEKSRNPEIFLTSHWQGLRGERISKPDIPDQVYSDLRDLEKEAFIERLEQWRKELGAFNDLTHIPETIDELNDCVGDWSTIGPKLLFRSGVTMPFTLLLAGRTYLTLTQFSQLWDSVENLYLRLVLFGPYGANYLDSEICEWALILRSKKGGGLVDVLDRIRAKYVLSGCSDESFSNALSESSIDVKSARYFFSRLDYEMQKGWANGTSLPNFKKWSIEHILPQNPAEESSWDKAVEPNDQQECIGRIPNLLLVSIGLNSTMKNGSFSKKMKLLQERSDKETSLCKHFLKNYSLDKQVPKIQSAHFDSKGWTLIQMEHRREWIVDEALRIWPTL